MKVALTVRRDAVHALIPQIPLVETSETEAIHLIAGNVPAFFSLPTELIDREICEKNSATLQVIPYIVLLDPATNKFLVYMRGEAGQEGRLHGKCSLGFGGHIEDAVTDDASLTDVICEGITRELEEEIGYRFTDEEIADLKNFRDQAFFLYTNADEVGTVHLGLCAILVVDPLRFGTPEAGVITKSQWLSMDELDQQVQAKEIELEQWSGMFVALLVNNAREEAAAFLAQAQSVSDQELETTVEAVLAGDQHIAAGVEMIDPFPQVAMGDTSAIEAANATVTTPEFQAKMTESLQAAFTESEAVIEGQGRAELSAEAVKIFDAVEVDRSAS